MWVWQSQAPAGTVKSTLVEGCAALAHARRAASSAAASACRLVIMKLLEHTRRLAPRADIQVVMRPRTENVI
jgi:hypothetical protein